MRSKGTPSRVNPIFMSRLYIYIYMNIFSTPLNTCRPRGLTLTPDDTVHGHLSPPSLTCDLFISYRLGSTLSLSLDCKYIYIYNVLLLVSRHSTRTRKSAVSVTRRKGTPCHRSTLQSAPIFPVFRNIQAAAPSTFTTRKVQRKGLG